MAPNSSFKALERAAIASGLPFMFHLLLDSVGAPYLSRDFPKTNHECRPRAGRELCSLARAHVRALMFFAGVGDQAANAVGQQDDLALPLNVKFDLVISGSSVIHSLLEVHQRLNHPSRQYKAGQNT